MTFAHALQGRYTRVLDNTGCRNLLLIDEHKGRSVARKMAVEHIGTVGILMLAFDENLLTKDEVLESLKVLLAFDIRLSRKLCNKVLHYVGIEDYF